ncbi:MAG: hypothetical protein IPJ98_09000 [Bryobacterales bacterium]|nr:hypothetical protein [Bryobacterales bacterium]
MADELHRWARVKAPAILAHNCLFPESQKVAGAFGGSLGLCRLAGLGTPRRLDFVASGSRAKPRSSVVAAMASRARSPMHHMHAVP